MTLELIDEWVAAAREVVLPVNVGEVCGFELTSDGVAYLANPLETDFGAAAGNDDFVSPKL